MNNEFPELKKEMEKIKVPMEKLDLLIEQTIKENKIKKSWRKKVFYSLGAAVVVFGVFMGSAIASPAMAKVASHLPLVGNFFNDSEDEGLRIAGQKGLTQVIEQTSKDNGITLTMNEIFYDGTRLTLGYTHEALFPIGRHFERPTIEVNGKEINFSSGSRGDFITPIKYKGTIDITPTEELPEEFELKMRIDAVGIVPGKWEFAFPVKQSNKVIVVKPEESRVIEEAEVSIASLKIGPAGTNLNVKITADEQKSKLDIYGLNFYLIDEEGHLLNPISGSGSGNVENGKEIAQLNYLFTPLKEGMKHLTLIPYTYSTDSDREEAVIVKLEEQTVPFILDQGDFGTVEVKDIVSDGEKTVIYYEVYSDFVIDNYVSQNPVWIEDAEGNNLYSEENPLPERIEGNLFRQEFITGNKEDLIIKTYKYSKPAQYEPIEIEIP